MDVERLLSSYNLVKSSDRSSFSGETLQDYLILRHNMPCIAKFDVRQAVEQWMSKAQRKPCQDRDVSKFMHQDYVASFFANTSNDSKSCSVPKVQF